MSERYEVTIIILAWNRWYLTQRCLDTLLRTELDGVEVIVVDNGSTDLTAEHLKEYDNVKVLSLPRNVGFVRGNNEGIKYAADGSDVVLVNNDIEFFQEDWLKLLRETAGRDDETGVVAPRLVNPDGRLLHAGTYILPDNCWGQQIGSEQKDIGQYNSVREVQGVVFACAYIKRSVISRIGLLSEDYITYFEDTDYCLRALEAGFKVVVDGRVTLVHDEHGSTRGDDDGMMKMFRGSQRKFKSKWKRKLERFYRGPLLWQSILNFPTGYAMSSREFLLHLDAVGLRAIYRYVYGPGTVFPIPENAVFDDSRLNVFARRRSPIAPPVSVVYAQGDVFEKNKGKYKIGFTMLEVDGFPKEWVSKANQMDEVWVPSWFNKEGFLSCGLQRPIYQIPLGVDTNFFNPKIQAYPNQNGDFVFLSVFEWGERKGAAGLLQAFNDEFKSTEPVLLLCKINNKDRSIDLNREIGNLGLFETGGRIAIVYNQEYSRIEMGSLYCSVDCFVSPARGEGWNMPLLEAMACGLPAIATDWGGQTEFFNAKVGYPLRVKKLIPAVAKCPYYAGFRWADPDLDHLRYLMRFVIENQEDARQLGLVASEAAARDWTWQNSVEKMTQRLSEVY